MPVQVKVDDELLEFPDDMSDDEIQSVLRREYPSDSPQSFDDPLMASAAMLALPEDFQIEAPPRGVFTAAGGPQIRTPGDGSFGRDVSEGVRRIPETAGQFTREIVRPMLSGTELEPEQSLVGPLREMVPTGKKISESIGLPEWISTPVSGGAKSIAGLGEFMASPVGAAEMGIAAIPGIGLLQRAKFIKDMAEGAGQSAGSISPLIEKAIQDPSSVTSEEAQQIAEGSADTALMLLGSGKLTSHQFSQMTGVRAPVGRFLETERSRISKDVAEMLKRSELSPIPEAAPTPQRGLATPRVLPAFEPFARPEIQAMAGEALREAQGPRLEIPGELSALERLRREIEPPVIEQVEPTRLADRVPGGGEAPYGKVSYRREAEAPTTERTQNAIQQEATGTVPNVRQSEVTQTGEVQVPVSEGSPKAAEARVTETIESVAATKPGEFFSQAERWSKEAMSPEGGVNPQFRAELVALRNPDVVAWQQALSKASAEFAEIRDRAKADPNLMSSRDFQHEFSGAAQKSQFFSEGLAVLEGRKAADPRTLEMFNRESAKIEPDPIISKLESLKFPDKGEGRLYSLPHPDAIKAIGRSTWNSAVDAAIVAVKAGKKIAEAIDEAIKYLRRQGKQFDEAQIRKNLEYEVRGESAAKPAVAPKAEAAPVESQAGFEAKDPITGEPAKMITEKAAKAMESKVKIPAEADVRKLTEQIDLFNREIGDALETGGQFLAKELRPDVAKGSPAERGTVTNKEINQYFVNKLSSIRKQMQATKQRIAQQADIESQVYFDTLQKRFETAFRQVQELRRASHEALYFWNKIRAEYQDIARAAGAMPEMKRQIPVLDQIWKDFRDGQPLQAGRHAVDYLRMNLFTPGSWTLDFGTNLVASVAKIPAWAIMDLGAMATGRAPTKMFSAIRALQNGMRNWNPLGRRYRLPEAIESELGVTAGGEFGGRGREVFVDFSEILKDRPELADKLRHIDKVIAAPVRMKRSVDAFFGRFGAAAELYNRAYIEGKSRGLKGDELKSFAEEFVQNPPEAAVARAVKTGKELKFNRDLTKWEEAFAGNILTKLVVEAFPRWTLQFIRWGGEMIGADPVFFKDLVTGKATPEQAVNYLTKAATGWGGIYAFNQLAYDNIDANSMEYVKEDGNRVRLSGRTPAPELFFICALLRGDTEKAKAALQHLSLPGAKLLSGEPAGILSPLIDTVRESIRGRYTAEQTARELTKLVNDAIPGKSVLGFFRSIYDPTIREGIGAPIPGVASLLPQRADPTTGEPLAPKTRIPGTKIELPTVGGTPFPGAERVLNDVQSALLDHGLGLTRPRRTSIIELPAEDVPREVRREYEVLAGQHVKQMVGDVIKTEEFKTLPFEVRRAVLSELLSTARTVARAEIAEKHGTGMAPVKSEPLNIQRLPERLRK